MLWRGDLRGWSEWPAAAYYVLLGAVAFLLLRREQTRRRALLARLESVSDAPDG